MQLANYVPTTIDIGDLAERELALRVLRGEVNFFTWNLALKEEFVTTQKQLDDFKILADPCIDEAFILASRGGSKTYDCLKVILYYASIGYWAVFWASDSSQIDQPKHYLTTLCNNTFLQHTITVNNIEEKKFRNGGWFQIRNLTPKKARSRRVDVAGFDEEREADEEALRAAYATMSNSKLRKKIHLTTPLLGSPAHTTWKRMKQEGKPLIIRHYSDCPYINPAEVEYARKEYPDWYFKQEYECEWTAASGRIFSNVEHEDFTTEISAQNKIRDWVRTWDHCGVDWNPVYGHVMVWTRYDQAKTTCFVTHESNLGTDGMAACEQLFDTLILNPHMKLEMEDGGTNIGFCEMFFGMLEDFKLRKKFTLDEYLSIARRSYRRNWDSEGKNKMKSITNLYPLTIMVDDARTPQTAEWLDKASWDKKDTSGKPKVLKDPEMHWFDAFLHSSWVAMYG